MLRPILAFTSLCLAAFLLAPTISVVHEKVEGLGIKRAMPWQLWQWHQEPTPPSLPGCDFARYHLYSEVTDWPERIQKDEVFTLGGVVQVEEEGRRGIAGIEVDLFLNETKEEPGIHLGTTTSGSMGRFTLSGTVPFELQASKYHLVAHAKSKTIVCKEYHEHWSDPEMEVVSPARIVWDDPPVVVVGRNTTLNGTLVDAVGAPVLDAPLNVTIGGERIAVTTDGFGRFSVTHTPTTVGNLTAKGKYEGNDYYGATEKELVVPVRKEHVEIAAERLIAERSREVVVDGRVFVREGVDVDDLRVRLEGIEADAGVTAEVADDGSFRITFTVPSTEEPGPFTLSIGGDGLDERYAFDGTLVVPTTLTIDAAGTGFFTKGFAGNVTLTDEIGRPLAGRVVVAGPHGTTEGATDSLGALSFGGEAGCGTHHVQASYGGDEHTLPASTGTTVGVCGFLAFVPGWALGIPWWAFALAFLVPLAGWLAYRRWRDRYAAVITQGPPLALAFTHPDDAAAGVVGVGEPIVATAALEQALPDGHALRIGTFDDMREVPLDADLRASLAITPRKLGGLAIRAEIVDKRGHVVSRRTREARVVRYAAEIERRYLAFKRDRLGEPAEVVSPREFEAFLRERAPGLDPAVARRLVGVFEEADYGPREAGREELLAYLGAEQAVPEVSPDALA